MSWLPALLERQGAAVEIQSMTDSRLSSALERAVRFGKTLVLTQAEKIDPVCIEALRSRFGTAEKIRVGQRLVEVHEAFRLLMIASDDQHLDAHLRDLVSIVHFALSSAGLEGVPFRDRIWHSKAVGVLREAPESGD